MRDALMNIFLIYNFWLIGYYPTPFWGKERRETFFLLYSQFKILLMNTWWDDWRKFT